MRTNTCTHSQVRVRVEPYTGPVSLTRENPAAHGGVTEVAVCATCGAERHTNVNGWAIEVGEWYPARASHEED